MYRTNQTSDWDALHLRFPQKGMKFVPSEK